MLAQRGITVSYETVRCWTLKFGPQIAANHRRRKLPPSPRRHPDEMVNTIAGERVCIWRAVDEEGEVMDMLVQKKRDTRLLTCRTPIEKASVTLPILSTCQSRRY